MSFHNLKLKYLIKPEISDSGADIISGLSKSPKSLPPRYFYDQKGSQLFEAICELPEYYLTRTEENLLKKYANAIAAKVGVDTIVELGSGSSKKTRQLLDAYYRYSNSLSYVPIDVSHTILQETIEILSVIYPKLHLEGLVSTYDLALENLSCYTSPPRLLCFLGSSLGNFSPNECDRFFSSLSASLERGDFFLLGVDLDKPKDILEAAYNDSQGVTAAFNLNMLAHLNWRFGGNFDLNNFEHEAIYNQEDSQIEMYLVSRCNHSVSLSNLDFTVDFYKGEAMMSEISRKFHLNQLKQQLENHGLKPVEVWLDDEMPFGLILCLKQ